MLGDGRDVGRSRTVLALRALHRGAAIADNNPVEGKPPPTSVAAGVRRAALAFSVLPTPHADAIAHLLTMRERVTLRNGLSQVRDADDGDRIAALHALLREVRAGIDWPVLDTHNPIDCPFHCIDGHPLERVANVFGLLAERQALTVAVALCHIPSDTRDEVWGQLDKAVRAQILPELGEVPQVGTVRTRLLAREVGTRLTRLAKLETTRPTT